VSGHEFVGLLVALVACLAAGGIGARLTAAVIPTWYAALRKPSWNPPNRVFGPVWTALYVLMAVAAWMVWRTTGVRGAPVALGLFVVQLALNAAWSPIFFGLRKPGWAAVDLVALWAAIVATGVAFSRVRPLAGYLLLPYLAWVTFAGALNVAIWRLNRR